MNTLSDCDQLEHSQLRNCVQSGVKECVGHCLPPLAALWAFWRGSFCRAGRGGVNWGGRKKYGEVNWLCARPPWPHLVTPWIASAPSEWGQNGGWEFKWVKQWVESSRAQKRSSPSGAHSTGLFARDWREALNVRAPLCLHWFGSRGLIVLRLLEWGGSWVLTKKKPQGPRTKGCVVDCCYY